METETSFYEYRYSRPLLFGLVSAKTSKIDIFLQYLTSATAAEISMIAGLNAADVAVGTTVLALDDLHLPITKQQGVEAMTGLAADILNNVRPKDLLDLLAHKTDLKKQAAP